MEPESQDVVRTGRRNVELSIVDLINIFRRRRLIILVAVLLAAILGFVLALRPRKYVADGSMWIQPGTASMYRMSPMNMLADEASDKLASEAEILKSRTLYLRVAKELNLYSDPAFVGQYFGRRSVEELVPAIRSFAS